MADRFVAASKSGGVSSQAEKVRTARTALSDSPPSAMASAEELRAEIEATWVEAERARRQELIAETGQAAERNRLRRQLEEMRHCLAEEQQEMRLKLSVDGHLMRTGPGGSMPPMLEVPSSVASNL